MTRYRLPGQRGFVKRGTPGAVEQVFHVKQWTVVGDEIVRLYYEGGQLKQRVAFRREYAAPRSDPRQLKLDL